MTAPIHFAIIGCGNIAQKHAAEIHRVGKLVAVCDIDESKAQHLAQTYQAAAYHSLEALLQHPNIHIVSICTPNALHAPHAIACLQKGMHVLCEKPLAINTTDATAMLQTAKKTGKHLFVVKQNRFNPPVQAVHQLLQTKALGNISSIQLNCFWNRNQSYYQNTWRGTKSIDGGTLFTQFSHFIDLIYWFFGPIQQVKAFATNAQHQQTIQFEDCGVVALQFANNILGTLHYTINSYQQNMEGSLTIFGQNGTIKIGGAYLNTIEYQSLQAPAITNLPQGSHANQYGSYTGSMSNHHLVYDNIIQVLQHKQKPYATAEEAYHTVDIIQKIYQATERITQ